MTWTFVVDCPGWSLDAFARRVGPFVGPYRVHYVWESLESLRARDAPRLLDIPRYGVLYFTSWWWLYAALDSGWRPDPSALVMMDIVDDSSWLSNPGAFAIADSAAHVRLSQSEAYLTRNSHAAFHPYPVPEEFLTLPKPERDPFLPARIGMVSNGFLGHEGGQDHKGIFLAREALDCDGLRGEVILDIAGQTRYIEPEGMPDWYGSLDAFACLSVSEGFSAATSDAIALGVPVVGTAVSPLVPHVPQGGFILVKRDVEAVRAAFRQVLDAHRGRGQLPTARPAAYAWIGARVASILMVEAAKAWRSRLAG